MAQISTRKRGSTWEYSFEIASVDGKRKRKSKGGFRTKKECLEAGTQAKAEYDNCGSIIEPSNMSLSDWLDQWYKDCIENKFKESTKETYQSVIRKLKADLGNYKISALKPITLHNYFNELVNGDYATSTVRNIRRIINSSLNHAYRMELIKSNPCSKVRIATSEEEKYKFPITITPEQFKQIINSISYQCLYYKIPFYIGWYTGMRGGEVLALTWDDVDFEAKTIRVNKTHTQAFGEVMITTPKTPNAVRSILVGDKLLDILKMWRERQINNAEKLLREPPNEICTRLSLEPIKASNLGQQCIKLAKQLNIDFHFHCLRHTHATILIKNGVSIKEVQARLGHKSIQTTLDIYTHIKASETEKSVDVFENL